MIHILWNVRYYGMLDTNQYDNTRAIKDTGVMTSYNDRTTHTGKRVTNE